MTGGPLTLYGPGTMNVVDETGTAFTKANQNTPREINTITVSGTITANSRLMGKVTPAANSDGRVFFQTLNVEATGAYPQLDSALVRPGSRPHRTASRLSTSRTSGWDIPAPPNPLFIPGSIGVLRRRGHQCSRRYPDPSVRRGRYNVHDRRWYAAQPNRAENEFIVNLGLPIAIGTSVIVDKVITDAQQIAATGTSTTGTVNQQSVTFLVSGRLNLFQANEIIGNATPANSTTKTPSAIPSQFDTSIPTPPTPAGSQPGGTYVVSMGTVVTGAIGKIKIGGNATNFTTFALVNDIFSGPNESILDPKINTFFVGGETNNVLLIAPGGSRNVYFGKGMDNTKISTVFIQNLQANRGAVNSTVTVDRTIDNMVIGGDVTDTNIQVGYAQTLATYANVPSAASPPPLVRSMGPRCLTFSTPSTTLSPALPNHLPTAAGRFTAGLPATSPTRSSRRRSIPTPRASTTQACSSDPPVRPSHLVRHENIVLPHGIIKVKVEGTIDNAALQAEPGDAAVLAGRSLHHGLLRGPDGRQGRTGYPPNVPEAPYPQPVVYNSAQRTLKGLFRRDNSVKIPRFREWTWTNGLGQSGMPPNHGQTRTPRTCPCLFPPAVRRGFMSRMRPLRRCRGDTSRPGSGWCGRPRRPGRGPRPGSSQAP